MALTAFQRELCRLLADHRIASGESDVAGGVALGEALASSRLSRDVDLSHDTAEAVTAAWEADRKLLLERGYSVRPTGLGAFQVRAEVRHGPQVAEIEWSHDSAFRFFPLVTHPDFGLTLHPLDLATNKMLASVGRLEPRDWVDLIECHTRLQPLGYLAWAACGKDPGYTPRGILGYAARLRYAAEELAVVEWGGPAPDPAGLSRAWKAALAEASKIVDALPAEHAGRCVLTATGEAYRGGPTDLAADLPAGGVTFHSGFLRGALPTIAAPR
jgi:hypothetical protein